jgi:hypothetical protein
MEILANEGDWTHTDEAALASFLETPTGRRLIPALVSTSPGLMACGDVNAILIRSGEVRAFQTILESILTLAHPPTPFLQPASSHPDLEDDAAWNDGQHLDVPKPETSQTPS